MIRLRLSQFQCWNNITLEIPAGSITLIKGSSGAGKTTLLLSIIWCLYGTVRKVHPNGNEKARTEVTIELPFTFNGVSGTLTITRQKNPKRLIVSHLGVVYEDAVAQTIINDYFGAYDVWAASCYIEAGERNNFLKASNTSKMEFLNNIAFHEEDPSVYIDRIDTAIADTENTYKMKLAAFNARLTGFTALAANVQIDKALTPGHTAIIKDKIRELTAQKTQLQTAKMQRDVNLGMLANLQQQHAQSCSKLFTVPEPSDVLKQQYGGVTPATTESMLSHVTSVIPLLQRKVDLESKINDYNTKLKGYTETTLWTSDDLKSAIVNETVLQTNTTLARSLGVVYSSEAIAEAIDKYRVVLQSQDRLNLEKELQTLQRTLAQKTHEFNQVLAPLVFPDLTAREIPVPDYSVLSSENLDRQRNEISMQLGQSQAHVLHLQASQNITKCPNCDVSLRYQHGTLVACDIAPVTSDELLQAQEKVKTLTKLRDDLSAQILQAQQRVNSVRLNYEKEVAAERSRITALQQKTQQLELEQQRRALTRKTCEQHVLELTDKIAQLQSKIETMPVPPPGTELLTSARVEALNSAIVKLQNIVIVQPQSPSSSHIQSCLTYQNIIKDRETCLADLDKHKASIPEAFRDANITAVNIYVQALRKYHDSVKYITEEIIRNDRLVASLLAQIADINSKIGEDPSATISAVDAAITGFNEELRLSDKAHNVLKQHKQITDEREDVMKVNAELSNLQSLRQIAVQTECTYLQQVVDSINASMESVCGTLFDRDISINLSLFKAMKTTKVVKPVANFTINYQGGTYDNVNGISRGEGDRMSVGLTIALNKLSSCPLLILDEPFAFLDLNMKDAAVRTIREHINNTVLICMHGGVEGIFDHVVDVDALRESLPLAQ